MPLTLGSRAANGTSRYAIPRALRHALTVFVAVGYPIMVRPQPALDAPRF